MLLIHRYDTISSGDLLSLISSSGCRLNCLFQRRRARRRKPAVIRKTVRSSGRIRRRRAAAAAERKPPELSVTGAGLLLSCGGIYPSSGGMNAGIWEGSSVIHISEPTRLGMISYAVFCLKKKKKSK